MSAGLQRALAICMSVVASAVVMVAAQTPPRPLPSPQPPARPAPQTPATPPPQAPAPSGAPTQAMLGLPIYPGAQFLAAYDAGRGQRYYLFGTPTRFEQAVSYYKNVLKDKGDLVFEVPPTHMFEVGKFREEEMAFPPGVTVKDYTWGGSEGFPNPKPGGSPARFPTIIQIVPLAAR